MEEQHDGALPAEEPGPTGKRRSEKFRRREVRPALVTYTPTGKKAIDDLGPKPRQFEVYPGGDVREVVREVVRVTRQTVKVVDKVVIARVRNTVGLPADGK